MTEPTPVEPITQNKPIIKSGSSTFITVVLIMTLIMSVTYIIVNTIQLYLGYGPYSNYIKLGNLENYMMPVFEELFEKRQTLVTKYMEFAAKHPELQPKKEF